MKGLVALDRLHLALQSVEPQLAKEAHGWLKQISCSHVYLHFVIKTEAWNRRTMKGADKFLLCQILVFGVVLPTVDTFSDLVLSGQLFVSGHILWALAVLLPVLVNFLFIVVAFRQFPFAPWHHRYVSLTMLVFQVIDL